MLQDDAYDVLQEAEDTTEGLRTQVQLPTQSFCCRTGVSCMHAGLALVLVPVWELPCAVLHALVFRLLSAAASSLLSKH